VREERELRRGAIFLCGNIIRVTDPIHEVNENRAACEAPYRFIVESSSHV